MGDTPEIRVGHDDRERAIAALNEHLNAGRLSLTEFDERSARAIAANTRRDLDALFADLPPLPARASAPPPPQPVSAPQQRREFPRGPVMALMPFVALILFMVTDFPNNWLFFLLVPISAILLFGFGGSENGESGKC